jgi:hypothetical protein
VPFDSETNSEFQIQKAHLETPPPRPSIFNPEIGIQLEKFILQALQKRVEKRFQSARDMIEELHGIRGQLVRAGLTAPAQVTQKIVLPRDRKRRLLLAPLKVLAFLALLVAGIALFLFLTGKSGMDENMANVPGEKTLPASQARESPEAAGAALPELKPDEKAAEREVGAAGQKILPQPASSEPLADQGTQTVRDDPGPAPAGQPPPVVTGETVAGPTRRRDEPGAGQVPGETAVESPMAAEAPLGSLDEELERLRQLLENRNLLAADRLANALVRSRPESRAFPLLGKVKFLTGQFPAAARLWTLALQDNLFVSLEVTHLHGEADDFCSGQLKFKKKLLLFNSATRGDHSLALAPGNLRPLTLGSDMAIHISGMVGGQEIDESFMAPGKLRRQFRQKFLVDFINQHVL